MVSGGADNLLKVWDLAAALAGSATPADGAKPGKLKATAATAAHDKDINAVAVAPNDSLICTASQDRTAKVIFGQNYSVYNSTSKHMAATLWLLFITAHHLSVCSQPVGLPTLVASCDIRNTLQFYGHSNNNNLQVFQPMLGTY